MPRNPSRDLATAQEILRRVTRKRDKLVAALADTEQAVVEAQARVDSFDGIDMTASAAPAAAAAGAGDTA